MLRARVIVGAPATPTPTGLFAVDAPVDLPGGNELGRRILAITAYSRKLARYQGGIPQIAFHEYEQLGAPLGVAASHGCIRMSTRDAAHAAPVRAPRHAGPHPSLNAHLNGQAV